MYRDIKFDVIYRIEGGWKREAVTGIKFEKDQTGLSHMLAYVAEGQQAMPIDWENSYLLEASGMFDKNNVPVYHGSVLKNAEGKYFEVFYAWGAFFIVESEESDRIFLTDQLMMTLEVAGDVFQNPELATKPIDEEKFINKVEENANQKADE